MNKNHMRSKVAALAMAFVMMLGLFASIPAVHAQEIPKAAIQAKNVTVEEDLKVNAYQIVRGQYAGMSLMGYELVDGTNAPIENIENPTADEITTIANNIGTGAFNATAIPMEALTTESTTYQAMAEPGLYIILVSGATKTVYNPAIVAVNVKDANDLTEDKLEAGSVELDTFFRFNGEQDTTVAYLKSYTPGLTKIITPTGAAGNNHGDTAAFGGRVGFEIETQIPSFSQDYTAPVFKITDKLEKESFGAITDVVVTVNDDVIEDTNYTLTMDADSKGFEVAFTQAYLRSVAGAATRPNVKITYESTLLDTATLNFAENKNTATLTYSNDPADESSYHEESEHTYHYTFGIDANIDAHRAANEQEETHEFNKVTIGRESYTEKTSTIIPTGKTQVSEAALEGATFALYSDEELTNQLREATSDVNGHVNFEGLNIGTYYIKEIAAPTGYTINPTVFKVEITATIDDAGVLTSYSMVFEQKAEGATEYTEAGQATYTATSTVEDDGNIEPIITTEITPVEVVNTKLSQLPSTGGSGTAITFVMFSIFMVTVGVMVAQSIRESRKLSAEKSDE